MAERLRQGTLPRLLKHGTSCRCWIGRGLRPPAASRDASAVAELLREMAGIKLDARPWSANSLNQYIGCPFSFFCRYVLGIEPTDSVGDDVDARDRGTCLHDIAKEFIESHIGEVLDPAKADEYAEEIREIACDVVGRTPSERSGIPESVWDAYFAGIIAASRDFVARELEFAEATGGVWRPATWNGRSARAFGSLL
jgi:hypothetical protein